MTKRSEKRQTVISRRGLLMARKADIQPNSHVSEGPQADPRARFDSGDWLLSAYQERWAWKFPLARRKRLCGFIGNRLFDATLHFLALTLVDIRRTHHALAHHLQERARRGWCKEARKLHHTVKAKRPFGRSTRNASATALPGRGKCNMPNAHVTASKLASAY